MKRVTCHETPARVKGPSSDPFFACLISYSFDEQQVYCDYHDDTLARFRQIGVLVLVKCANKLKGHGQIVANISNKQASKAI